MAPCFYVLFDGYVPTRELSHGKVQQLDQSWRIVAVVKNAKGQTSGKGIREEAGPMLELMLTSMAGYQVSSEFSPFSIAPSNGPQFTEQFGYFEVNLSTRVMVRMAKTRSRTGNQPSM